MMERETVEGRSDTGKEKNVVFLNEDINVSRKLGVSLSYSKLY